MTATLPIFRTITSADWSRSISLARATPNQIRARIASRFPRQVTAQSESRPVSQPAATRRPDAFLSSRVQNRWTSHVESDDRKASGECTGEELSFTAAGSADRKGGGTSRAEAGDGECNLSEGGRAARPCPDLVETRPLTATPRPTWGAQNFTNIQNIT